MALTCTKSLTGQRRAHRKYEPSKEKPSRHSRACSSHLLELRVCHLWVPQVVKMGLRHVVVMWSRLAVAKWSKRGFQKTASKHWETCQNTDSDFGAIWQSTGPKKGPKMVIFPNALFSHFPWFYRRFRPNVPSQTPKKALFYQKS